VLLPIKLGVWSVNRGLTDSCESAARSHSVESQRRTKRFGFPWEDRQDAMTRSRELAKRDRAGESTGFANTDVTPYLLHASIDVR
jgi:hypothetical protein